MSSFGLIHGYGGDLATPIRLAVLDDSPRGSSLLSALFADHGFDTLWAGSRIGELLRLCAEHQPSVVLVSIDSVEKQEESPCDIARKLRDACPDAALIGMASKVQTYAGEAASSFDAMIQGAFHAALHKAMPCSGQGKSSDLFIPNGAVFSTHGGRGASAIQSMRMAAYAFIDPVTELPNRLGIQRSLKALLREGGRIGALFIAVDGIEGAVQLYGYHKGEALMKSVAERLQDCLSEGQRLGVWGGSELLALIPYNTRDDLLEAGKALTKALEKDIQLDNIQVAVSARVGAASCADSCNYERMVHQASLALPVGEGPSVQHYSEALESEQRRRLSLQRDIRYAARRGELHIQYQPKVNLFTGQVVGAEALLRWRHRHHGAVSPDQFIALAEESGDIVELGEWVIQQVAEQVAVWEQAGELSPEFTVAVNVAPRQVIRPGFADMFIMLVSQAGVALRRVSVEITESGLMMKLDRAAEQLEILRKAGVGVAIDDFGMGVSSLSRLKSLPITILKIDKAFVSDLSGVEGDHGKYFAETVTRLAHGIGCSVVAEGVETLEQHDLLKEVGCEEGQGYLYSRPLHADDFMAWQDRYLRQGFKELSHD